METRQQVQLQPPPELPDRAVIPALPSRARFLLPGPSQSYGFAVGGLALTQGIVPEFDEFGEFVPLVLPSVQQAYPQGGGASCGASRPWYEQSD